MPKLPPEVAHLWLPRHTIRQFIIGALAPFLKKHWWYEAISSDSVKMAHKMIINLRSIVYAVILLVTSVYSWTAKGDAGPPYNGPSVFVPFVNASDVSNPLKYVSPQINVGIQQVPMLITLTRYSMSLWTPGQ